MPKFLRPIDLSGLEIQNAILQNLAAEPTTKLSLGRIYYDTADGKVKVYAHITSGDKFCVIPWSEDLQSFLMDNGLDSNGYEVFVDSKGGTVTIPGKALFDNLKGMLETVLDTASNKVKISALPDAILGQLMFGGTVNANNVAMLSSSFRAKYGVTAVTLSLTADMASQYEGVYFIATGASSLVSSTNPGDWIVSNGNEWTKIDNTDAVRSVAGLLGAITAEQLQTALGLKGAAYMDIADFIGSADDEEDAETIYGVRNYVDSKIAKIANSGLSFKKYTITGNGTLTSFKLQGNGGAVLSVLVTEGANPAEVVYPDIEIQSTESNGKINEILTITFANAPASGTKYYVRVAFATMPEL